MPRPAILMLELDPATEQDLNEALSAAGFDVYAADSVNALGQALSSTPFSLVMCDADMPNSRPSSVLHTLQQVRADTPVIFTGREASAARILDILRGGGADFVQKPVNPTAVVERVREVLRREQARRGAFRHLRQRAEAAEQELARVERSSASRVSGLDDQLILSFAKGALQTFMDVEQRTADLEKAAAAASDDGSPRRMVAWIMHPDDDFVRGMMSLAPRANLDFLPPLTSGGEVLDKLGTTPPDLLVLGESLPDIPTPLVIETVKNQYPAVELLIIEGWGTSSRAAALVSGSYPAEERRALGRADDLLALIDVARERSADASFGRDFAERFRDRHKEFLRRYAELMKRLGAPAS
jgi:DNA-binding response OmpR family regulator